jgi:hypothetical protein
MSRRLALGLLLLVATAAVARAEEEADDVDEKDVVVLTDANFEEKMASAKYALVSSGGAP